MIHCAYHEKYRGNRVGVPHNFIFDTVLSLVVISSSNCFTDGDRVLGNRSHEPGISVTSVPVWAFWKREIFLPLLGIEPRFHIYTAHNLDITPITRELTYILKEMNTNYSPKLAETLERIREKVK
jgi:hypothetical protein